ncbi:conjugal transfer protein TrbE [Acidithiobacillus sp. YTS05]|nr:conjugal transfer protein TrbE [Acidithiobacillus sp. YTS05]
MLNIKAHRSRDLAFPDLLNPAILAGEFAFQVNAKGDTAPCAVLLNKDGSFLSVLQFAGPDLESTSDGALNRVAGVLNRALVRLGSGWSVHISAIRSRAEGYIPEDQVFFIDPVSTLIDAERRMQFEEEGAHFVSRYYLALTWQVPAESEVFAGQFFVETKRQEQRDTFQDLLQQYGNALNAIGGILRQSFLVSPRDAKGLLTHYHECLTGRTHGVNPPLIPAYLDVLLGHHDFIAGLEPAVDGEPIEVITVTGYPDRTQPEMLEVLHNLPFPLRYTTRFILMDARESKKLIAQYREKWSSSKFSLREYLSAILDKGQVRQDRADKFKESLEQETVLADADVSSGAVVFGYVTATIVLRGKDTRTLAARVQTVIDLLENANFVPKRETINAVDAFLGSLPGHTWENVRRPVVNSLNFVDLSPKTAVWAGSAECPSDRMRTDDQQNYVLTDEEEEDGPARRRGRKAPCLAYAQSSGGTPFRFNLHVTDVGHSLIMGLTGGGKSTLLALLGAQWLRYPKSRVIAFDKKMTMFTLTEAVGGLHYDLGGESLPLQFAPLSRIDQPGERLFAKDWLESLATLQGVTVTAAERALISQAVDGLAGEQGRSITDVQHLLQDQKLRQAIGMYVGTGKYGNLLDGISDGLDLSSRFVTFEMDNLPTGEEGKGIVAPLLLYLFHRIDTLLDGSPTLILLDEAWSLLDHPMFAAKIREWLKELRKRNAVVVFATQSLADLQNHPLLPVLQESCPTKIFLPNPEAGSTNLRPIYHAFGLDDKQIELLTLATQKQDYYIRSPLGSRKVSFVLGPVALAFCAVDDPRDIKRVQKLKAQYGARWPAVWLRERLPQGLQESWADYLDTLYQSFDRGVAGR